ncbi:iron-containing alcohol dehydrogenase [Neobacillus rhizophilus]|uniref:Iron-containing alcohol dehydrogenase n=1 Tax=Neobacillus rhizophilus TaxID=2833579 RepID=A0A942U0M4_9BACI|nr:iron-containing alcohol dehydrogenase [Neobacillus rhizophilus]MBS4211085.1 iron-containing alcohol dehydrogenase [Neobacillus rhizophilus]
MYELYCRTYQGGMKVASFILPWREPELLEGENSLSRLPSLIKSMRVESVLIVTDQGIISIGLMDTFLDGLKNGGIQFFIYDKTVPNPTIENIEEAFQMYKENKCQGIVAFGGGSPMDCAKGVGARAARPKKSIPQMKGVLKVLKRIPPLFAIPTTAGTGSEATLAAVVSNSETHEKYAIMDTALIPHYAVLDPLLTVKLPPHITAATGIDALTHAVEAYIGKSNTKKTTQCSIEAVQLIFENLYECYTNGTNIQARTNMQKAAYLAGIAFTRAYVGYVHAIAHTLGGFYQVPHGLANAIILPYVLEYYGESAHKPLSELADLVNITKPTDTVEQKARKFIDAIKELNEKMAIPTKVNGIIEKDIPLMVERALKEANPLYPVPKIFYKNDLLKLYHLIKE